MSVRSSAAKRLLKRWARRAMVAGSRAMGSSRADAPTPGLRILTYHRVADDPLDPFAVSPGDFARQMEMLSATGTAAPLGEALDRLQHGGEVSRVAVTFDDGTSDFLAVALPVLLAHRLPSTLYVSPARVGTAGFLGWDDLRRILATGVAIESHGLDHRSLGKLDAKEVWRQVTESRRTLEDQLGCGVTSLAYPFGTLRDFNAEVKEMIRQAGYRSACTSINGVNGSGADLLELRRTKIESGDGPIFRRILSGGLDGWAFVDRHLASIQNRYA